MFSVVFVVNGRYFDRFWVGVGDLAVLPSAVFIGWVRESVGVVSNCWKFGVVFSALFGSVRVMVRTWLIEFKFVSLEVGS